jgi:hypothetical protein
MFSLLRSCVIDLPFGLGAQPRRYGVDLGRLARRLGRHESRLCTDWQNVHRALAEATGPAAVPDRGWDGAEVMMDAVWYLPRVDAAVEG